MGTSSDMNSECEICGGQSFLVEDSHYDSTEEHCLNENCRYYYLKVTKPYLEAIVGNEPGINCNKI